MPRNIEISSVTLELPGSSSAGGVSLEPPIQTLRNSLNQMESAAQTATRLDAVTSLALLAPRHCSYADFCREVLHLYRKAIPSEAGSFFELRHTDQALFVRTAFGQAADKIENVTVPLGVGVVGHAAESRNSMTLSGDIDQSKVFLNKLADAVGFEARNVLVVPVIVRGKVFGVTELLNRFGKELFDKADIETAELISRVFAATLEVRMMLAHALHQKESGALAERTGQAEEQAA
jgi:GAF domain-containing protein